MDDRQRFIEENPLWRIPETIETTIFRHPDKTLERIIPQLEAELAFLGKHRTEYGHLLVRRKQDLRDAEAFLAFLAAEYPGGYPLHLHDEDDAYFPFLVRFPSTPSAGQLKRYDLDLRENSWKDQRKPYSSGSRLHDYVTMYLNNIRRGVFTAYPFQNVLLQHRNDGRSDPGCRIRRP
ncbi:MAG: hypothetical protein GXP63_02945 [DPANN group archaeon]|nr:hypothetical protein [DPANN group archaeon]